jgi:hypothetical protein
MSTIAGEFPGYAPRPQPDLDQQAEPPTVDIRQVWSGRLDEIAMLVRELTYGEMVELAGLLWAAKPPDKDVTAETLPMIWHKWSKPT